MAEGWGNQAIAERLFLAPKTVRNNVSAILTKLQADDRGAAVVRARASGYGQAPRAPDQTHVGSQIDVGSDRASSHQRGAPDA